MRLKRYLTNAQGNIAQLREQWILQKEQGFIRQQLQGQMVGNDGGQYIKGS